MQTTKKKLQKALWEEEDICLKQSTMSKTQITSFQSHEWFSFFYTGHNISQITSDK